MSQSSARERRACDCDDGVAAVWDAIDAKLKFKDADSRTVDVEEHHLRLRRFQDEVAEFFHFEAGLEGELELRACVRSVSAVRSGSNSDPRPPRAVSDRDESHGH